MSQNVLLLSPDIIRERTTIHGNVDPKFLYPEIKVAQDMYIHPILGTALYDKIISDVDGGTIAGAYKDLLDDYIIDALLFFVLAQLPEALSYQFYNKGIIRKQGDNTDVPSMSELIDISNRYRVRAEWYATRLTKYLKQNATTSFLPEYLDPGDGVDTIVPENEPYTMPVYLGDSSYCQSLDKNNCHG